MEQPCCVHNPPPISPEKNSVPTPPTRKSESPLWLTLKDKVLVVLSYFSPQFRPLIILLVWQLSGEILPNPTPLHEKLNNPAKLITKIGGAAGLILFTTLTIHFFAQLGTGEPAR
jgi:hypothetical protein